MSRATRRFVPALLCPLALALLFLPTVAAQERDPLPEVRQRLAVEAQRVEKEFEEGRRYAYQVARTEPSKAVAKLKALLETLERDKALKADRREILLFTLKYDLKRFDAQAADARNSRLNEAANRAVAADSRR